MAHGHLALKFGHLLPQTAHIGSHGLDLGLQLVNLFLKGLGAGFGRFQFAHALFQLDHRGGLRGQAVVCVRQIIQALRGQRLGAPVHGSQGNIVAQQPPGAGDKAFPGLVLAPGHIHKLGVPARQPGRRERPHGLGAAVAGDGAPHHKTGDILDIHAFFAHHQGQHGFHGKHFAITIRHGGLLGDRCFLLQCFAFSDAA